jgi:hypothetical protein
VFDGPNCFYFFSYIIRVFKRFNGKQWLRSNFLHFRYLFYPYYLIPTLGTYHLN